MRRLSLLLGLLVLGACDPAGRDDLIEIDASAVVGGTVFRDVDGNAVPGSGDLPANGVRVALVLVGTADTVARTQTGTDGVFVFGMVPVGRYHVEVLGTSLGDSLFVVYRDPPGLPLDEIADGDTTFVSLGVDDTVAVQIGLSYAVVDPAQARTLPSGRSVTVSGLALSSILPGTGDSAVIHVGGSDRAIRAIRATGADVLPSDSILVTGTLGTRSGQPVLLNASVVAPGGSAPIDTVILDALGARNAGGGLFDAMLARVPEVLVTDTSRSASRFFLTVEDPSGVVRVVLDTTDVTPSMVPGAEFSVTGLLVPRGGIAGAWDIRARGSSDLVLLP